MAEEMHSFTVPGPPETIFRVPAKYQLLKPLGKGAYGIVVACKNVQTGSKVAMKKITPMCASPTDGKHTLRELRLCRWLGKHPNIISLKDIIVDMAEDTVYVVMELYDTDLHKIIQSPQPLGDAHLKHFLYQLLRGLKFAHSYQIIHRDLKPANLLVTKNCDLCISDFGLARQMPTGTVLTDDGSVSSKPIAMTEHVVTRWYRAPELMLSADGNYTPAIDMWSVGCILAELLGRGPIFAGSDFMETLKMQIEILGTRPAEELSFIRSQQALDFLATLPLRPKVPWRTLFSDASDKVLDLLDKMLQFSAAKRISVEDALHHPFFDSVRSQYTAEDPLLATGPGGFNFSFENKGVNLTVPEYKKLIAEEAATFKAERAVMRKLREEGGGGSSSSAGGSSAAME